MFLLENFNKNTFTLPSVNKGQKVINAYMVDTKKLIKTKQIAFGKLDFRVLINRQIKLLLLLSNSIKM